MGYVRRIDMLKVYYHIIEYGDYGLVGHHGCTDKIEDAEKIANHLRSCYPELVFQIEPYNTKKEPPHITI